MFKVKVEAVNQVEKKLFTVQGHFLGVHRHTTTLINQFREIYPFVHLLPLFLFYRSLPLWYTLHYLFEFALVETFPISYIYQDDCFFCLGMRRENCSASHFSLLN